MKEASTHGFTENFVTTEDGLSLYVRDYGNDRPGVQTRLPVVCLAGLSRNSRDFHELAIHLSRRTLQPRRVITLDYRGRGRSDWDRDSGRYQLPVEAQDVVAICTTLNVDKADFIGTSRGGLILHLLAVSNPTLLNSVVLNDIGPVIELSGLLRIRDYLTATNHVLEWNDAVEHLKHLHGAAFPALKGDDWATMAHAIYRQNGREIVPDYDPALAGTLRDLKADTPFPDLWPLFDRLTTVPLLVIRGERSTILSEDTVKEMIHRHPNAKSVIAKGQGHAPLLHLEEPMQAIEQFLDALAS
jgi:pimeloyl-ACP methyl ester carboxylesterase